MDDLQLARAVGLHLEAFPTFRREYRLAAGTADRTPIRCDRVPIAKRA
jgi:hypothetical protein